MSTYVNIHKCLDSLVLGNDYTIMSSIKLILFSRSCSLSYMNKEHRVNINKADMANLFDGNACGSIRYHFSSFSETYTCSNEQ